MATEHIHNAWSNIPFKEQYERSLHWAETTSIGEHRFDIYCKKDGCKCFVLHNGVEIEYNGAKAEANRIIARIISKNEALINC